MRQAILIVDDEAQVIQLLEVALHAFFSVVVYSARSGNEAREIWKIQGDRMVALLCDVRLGNETGFDLVRELTAGRPELPVVYMSGHSYEAKELLHFGRPAPFLAKPFNLADLRSALAMLPPQPDSAAAA